VSFLVLAGVSALWALDPALSLRRSILQTMVVITVFAPPLLLRDPETIQSGLFVCFSLAIFVNLLAVIGEPPNNFGYSGIYGQKNALGEIAAIALLVGLFEFVASTRLRRLAGCLLLSVSGLLLLLSNSKASLLLAVVSPVLAAIVLTLSRAVRLSPVLATFYFVIGSLLAFLIIAELFAVELGAVLALLFGDPTLTGRTEIWNFSVEMIARRPLWGWGYGSFWLVGNEAPSVREAPAWLTLINDSHNGYLDIILQNGYIGLALVILGVVSAIHSVGHSLFTAPKRAWFSLSIIFFVSFHNFFETSWFAGFSGLWLSYLVVVANLVPGTALARVRRQPRRNLSPDPSGPLRLMNEIRK
jgi:O-antigen ligase